MKNKLGRQIMKECVKIKAKACRYLKDNNEDKKNKTQKGNHNFFFFNYKKSLEVVIRKKIRSI